ncbi:MAG: hydroxyisourate hydrolase [Elusimicrobia bacterium RIFCSPHIGHO2_02_FULL_57_9]|nr:MAG: hydroxyisourate hydrolase [Elusimicrobia bacterium RIFCSPHIGHO2_02_FULL_57_9]
MSSITTHVLDTTTGRPANGMAVTLESQNKDGESWTLIGDKTTDSDGRVKDLLPPGAKIKPGVYRLAFETGSYFAARKISCFHPTVHVIFEIKEKEAGHHHHVPLLLSPYGYSTYRGS